jgi:hypothetical protein
LPSGLPPKNLQTPLPSSMRATCPCPFFVAKESVHVRGALKHFVTIKNFYSEGCRSHAQPPSWRTTSCRLSATAYSIYSQLPSVHGGLPSIRNLRTRHAVVISNPPDMESYISRPN